ncbi:MAG: tRNA-specific adenosine deaminase [Pseudorhodoplanes sp.]|nr:tRNA-specific adenosine deaminase [Pseudorhodoplanes sp.]
MPTIKADMTKNCVRSISGLLYPVPMHGFCHRRFVLTALAGSFVAVFGRAAAARDALTQSFIDKAFEMKRLAERAGDQPYGAVVVRGGRIVGFGPSRVVVRGDGTAHAEREAMRDAQARLGRKDLSGCVMYSTARPCADCERAAAQAGLARMYYGADAHDAGAPRGS